MGRTVIAASRRPTYHFVLDVIACVACISSLASCALTSKGSSPAANPSIIVTPSLVSFGNVKIKTQTSQTLRLSNPGTKDLVISQAAISAGAFSVSGLTAPLTVAAGTSMNFTVLFQPTTTGTASASISISSNATSTPLTVSLTGTGVTASTPAISVTPTVVSFGNLTVKTSASQTVKLSNTGSADLAISQATLAGTGFSMSGLTEPMTVAAGASTSFTVSFQPTVTGAASGSISIVSNASPSPLVVSLTGTGVAATAPAISVTPSSVAFGNLTVKTSASQTLKISNTGTADLSISQASVSGTGFGMSGLTAPVTVAAGASMNFTVSFQPAAAGTVSGSISISSNAGSSPLSIPLTGTGVAAILTLSASPAIVAFGNVAVGTTATQNDQITNTGNAAVDITTISATGTGFSVTGGSNTILSPNQSVTVTVGFNPQTAVSASGSLTVSSNAPALNVSLSGTGTNGSSFQTNFPATENPISQGGQWVNGLADGLDWGNVQTIGNGTSGAAYGTTISAGPPYNDSIAMIRGTWGLDQTVTGTVVGCAAGPNIGVFKEISIFLRFNITAHNAKGFGADWSCNNANNGNSYHQFGSWCGPINDFAGSPGNTCPTAPSYNNAGGVTNGDVISVSLIGNVVTMRQNGVIIEQSGVNGVPFDNYDTAPGLPGIGFYLQSGSATATAGMLTDHGLTNVTVTSN